MAKSLAATSQGLGQALQTRFNVLLALSFSHFLNDMLQSLVIALYPLIKGEFHLNFVQIGAITLTYQICASLLQPVIGIYTDKRPQPYSLSVGMGFTLSGLVLLAVAASYSGVLVAAALIGTGSSIFHPESSRIARLASGGRHGLAQSIFQVGGNSGSAVGPLVAALIIIPFGQISIAWFAPVALLAMVILARVGSWYKRQHLQPRSVDARHAASPSPLSRRRVAWSMSILVLLLFSKYFYIASITSFYSFYLIDKFHVTVASAQIHLFLFLSASAIGTLFGGPIGDSIGRKSVIWASILGVAPFTLLLPYANLYWTGILAFIIGLILSSAFSAILVFAQELIPGKVGTVSGLFFGFAFGIGGIGAALLGAVADARGIEFVYRLCAYLPLLGVAAAFLPNLGFKARTSGH
jgi:FSR family fosmidomycin resistance protein-like MFS transporter